MTRWLLSFTLLASACGPSAPPPDEVTETWTAGDDAPLEEEPASDTGD